MLNRLNKRDVSPAEIVDRSREGFWRGIYTEVGVEHHWKDTTVWRLFYVTMAAGELREGFVRALSAKTRSEAVIALARHYTGSGLSLVLHAVVPPMSPELVNRLEIHNGKLLAERERTMGSGPRDESRASVPVEGRRPVPCGV